MTFVARNLPPKLIIFGIAAYALDVVVTNNVGALLQGMFADHLSWHWTFWTSAVLMPLVLVCVSTGIPVPSKTTTSAPKPGCRDSC